MKIKHKQMLIIWVGLLAGILLFRGGGMTIAGLVVFFIDLGLVWLLLRCPHCKRWGPGVQTRKDLPLLRRKLE